MVVPITNDLIVAAVAAVVLLGIQKVANAKSKYSYYLYSGFCQLNTESKFFSKKYIRIMRFLKCSFQFFQLKVRERGTISALFSFTDSS